MSDTPEYSPTRSVLDQAEKLSTVEEVIALYEKELTYMRSKYRDRYAAKRKEYQRKIKALENGEAYHALEDKYYKLLKKNEELEQRMFLLLSDNMRYKRIAEDEAIKQEELLAAMHEAEARAGKAERAANNLKLYMELAGGKKR